MANWIILEDKYKAIYKKNTIARILERRGVKEEEMGDFYAKSPKTTHDPLLMPDIKEAVDLILQSKDEGLSVCVYGDYDADGITSTALLIRILKLIFKKTMYYIPSRFVDGYGLNCAAIDKIAKMGTGLLITVDCGSTSAMEIEYAKKLGMKVIVTDHHTPDEKNEPDCIFVNPKRKSSIYPFKDISGCGVAFKLIQALQRRLGEKIFPKALQNAQLDLVAISTVADVVPLMNENRSFVKYGLRCINERKRTGLKILLDVLEYGNKEIDSERIAYVLAPNINALGRMDSAALAVALFSGMNPDGSDATDFEKMAISMRDNNLKRKEEQDKTLNICKEALKEQNCGEYFPVILAKGAHEGVTGIVAGNIKEELYKPVCIVTPTADGLLKGTGRSVPGMNIYEILHTQSSLFDRYGGHAGACGFTMEPKNLNALREGLQQQMLSLLKQNSNILEEKLIIEKELSSQEKTLEFAEALSVLEPYGEKNPKPLFCIRYAKVYYLKRIGHEQNHLQFRISNADRIPVDCVLYRKADDYCELLEQNIEVDVAGELCINTYSNYGEPPRLQFVVQDIVPSRKRKNYNSYSNHKRGYLW